MPGPRQKSFEDPRSYTPPHIAKQILSSRTAVEGERKLVTVLFCDIVNSTGLAERSGAEAMHRTLDAFFERALGEIHRFEGTVNQFLGDGFMALFGAPLSHEDHARRAILAAWALRESLRERPLRVGAGQAIAVRMGLNSGTVVVGAIGDSLRMDYTAIGDTTNLAARLQGLAEPGDILLTDSTLHGIEGWAAVAHLGARPIKGKAQPVPIHRLESVRSDRSAPGRTVGTLVGRKEELDAARSALRSLTKGRGGLLLIEGEAGIGKSLLLARAREEAAAAGIDWLQGSPPSLGETRSYLPFVEVIRQAAGASEREEPDGLMSKLSSLATGLFADRASEVLPYLATIVGLELPSELEQRVRYLDRRGVGAQILLTSRQLFRRLAERTPTVLAFEDAHWIDGSSAELLRHLAPMAATVPLLLAVTGRPETEALRRLRAETDRSRVTEVKLGPLGANESADLLDVLLEDAALGPSARAFVVRRAGGNPFFLEELVRSLSEGRSSGAEADLSTVPDTVHGVIMARVDRLSDGLRAVLSAASVIGPTFAAIMIPSLIDRADVDVGAAITELRSLDLVLPTPGSKDVFRFKHALVQEAIYDSLLVHRRKDLHRRVAEALETRFAPQATLVALAHHYAQAEVWDRAQRYLRLAGDQAGSIAAESEALDLYERAIQTYARAFGDRWDPDERAALERKIGEALFRLGRHDQAIEHLEAALDGFGRTYPRTDRGVRLAIGRELSRQAGHRLRPRTWITSADPPIDDRATELNATYSALAWMHYFIDPERYLLDVLLSLNHSERAGLRVGVARGAAGLGIAFDFVTLSRLAGRYLRRAIREAEEIGHPIARGEAYLGIGVHEFLSADLPAAFRRFTDAEEAYGEAGDLRGWGITRTLGSWALRLQGELETSLERDREVQRVAADSGDLELRAWAYHGQGRTLCLRGPLDEAIACCQEAVAVYRAIPAPLNASDALGDLAICLLRTGEEERAVEAIEEAAGFLRDNRIRGFGATQVLGQLAQVLVASAEREDGPERVAAMARAKRACRSAARNAKAVPLGAPATARARGTYAWLRGRTDQARKRWANAVSLADGLGWSHEVALAELEIGTRCEEPDRIVRARAIFERIGAMPDVERIDAAAASG